jgi:hypothetical protein
MSETPKTIYDPGSDGLDPNAEVVRDLGCVGLFAGAVLATIAVLVAIALACSIRCWAVPTKPGTPNPGTVTSNWGAVYYNDSQGRRRDVLCATCSVVSNGKRPLFITSYSGVFIPGQPIKFWAAGHLWWGMWTDKGDICMSDGHLVPSDVLPRLPLPDSTGAVDSGAQPPAPPSGGVQAK